jgi:hypothetical protein
LLELQSAPRESIIDVIASPCRPCRESRARSKTTQFGRHPYPSKKAKMPVNNPNVGVAFALVCGAGAATALGASVVFFPGLVKLASRRVLAGALGVSAGVMTYVSFVEIFNKTQTSFLDAGHSESNSYLYATLCFFAGVLVMLVSSNQRSAKCYVGVSCLCPAHLLVSIAPCLSPLF